MSNGTSARLLALHKAIIDTAPGISSEEYRAFLYISEHEGCCQRDIQDALAMPQSTVSRMTAAINGTGHGLISSEITPESRGKRTNLRLSDKGRRLLAQLAVLIGCFAWIHTALLEDAEPVASVSVSASYDRCADPAFFSCDKV